MLIDLRLKKALKILLISFSSLVLGYILYFYFFVDKEIIFLKETLLILKENSVGIKTSLLKLSSLNISQAIFATIFFVSLLFSVNYLLNIYFIEKRNALIDELTEIYNRKAMKIWMRKEIKRAQRFNHLLSIALLDLDNFKIFNDKNGHVKGDYLLKHISSILKKNTREIDFVGRYGGEEFIIIFPETSHKNALNVLERIRENVEKSEIDGMQVMPSKKVTISSGLVTFGKVLDEEEMLKKVDSLLYQAKNSGKNKVIHQEVD